MNQSFFARRSFTVLMVAVFMLPFVWVGTRRALQSNRNDVKDWLPDNFKETKTHRWFLKHFPLEQFVLVSWEGCTLEDPRLEFLARKLENFDPDLKELGITGRAAEVLQDNNLHTRRAIQQYGNLRSLQGIEPEQAAEVAATVDAWVSPFKSPILTGERLVERLQAKYKNLTREEVLERLNGSLIGRDHHADCLRDASCQCPYDKTCLVVTLSGAAKGKNLRRTLQTVRDVAQRDCKIPGQDIHMGGPPVDNVAIDVEGERTLYRLAVLSAVVGLGISWLCFRSLRLTFLVFFCALLAAGMGLASVYFTGVLATLIGLESIGSSYGTVDAILLSMPSLVYVLAISGAVHIINYYHDAVRDTGLARAPEHALAHGMTPCTLAAITTALGLGSLMASHLIPINKFGIYSAWGVLATLVLLFLFLPACLHFFPSREYLRGGAKNRDGHPEKTAIVRFWHHVGEVIIGHHRLVTAGCVAVMILFMVGLYRVDTSVKLMKLFSPKARIIHDYGWLEDQIGPLVPMEVVIRVDNQKCRLSIVERMRLVQQVERAVEELDDVGGALSAATLAPDIRPVRSSGGIERIFGINRARVSDDVLNRLLEKHREEFREYLTVDTDAAPADSARNPTLRELGITGPLAEALAGRKLTTLRAIERFGRKEAIQDNLKSLPDVGPQGAARVAAAVDAWRSAHGEELWRVSARVWALTDLDYGLFVDEIEKKVKPVLAHYRDHGVDGIDATYTGLVPLVYKAQHELMRGLYNSLKWAFALIALVMILVLRSPAAGLLSMIPNIFPVVVIFGAMGWLGILVDVGTMMTASVALGVAVDDTVHFLTWFRRGLDEGHDRKGAVMLAYERCGTAMTQTTLIGGLGLSMFAFSTFTPTQRFGVLMLTLLGAALFGDLIFLPALLSGPIGRFFRVGKKKPPEGPPGDGTAARRTDGDLHEDGAHKHAAPGKATARPRMGHSSMPPPHTRSSQRSPTAP